MSRRTAIPGAHTGANKCAVAALWYAARGLRVHPLRPGSKLPMLACWPERSTTDAGVIIDWWAQWPGAGIGIATGAASGVIVVDIDPRHGGDDAVAALEREHGELAPTWRCLTPGSGLHFYFRHPGGHTGNRVAIWPGIDLRGDGGYVVAPPTALADGRIYTWEAGHGPHELAPIAVPPWLLERLRPGGARAAREPGYWRDLAIAAVPEGRRNDALARITGHLLRRHVDPHLALALVMAWAATACRPPLDAAEVARTVDSIARRELMRRRAA